MICNGLIRYYFFFVEPISHFTYFRVTVQTNLLLYEPGRFSKIEPEIQGLHGSFMIHKSTKKQYNYSKIIDWYYFFFVDPISHLANFRGQCPNSQNLINDCKVTIRKGSVRKLDGSKKLCLKKTETRLTPFAFCLLLLLRKLGSTQFSISNLKNP